MLKAGFSRVDVTPPLGSYMAGYFFERYAKGVLDPIELNAIAYTDGKETVILIIADFIGVDMTYCDEIRQRISERVGVATDHIMLTSLHQHTSVCIAQKDKYTRKDLPYMDMVYRKYCDVAQMALDDMKEATLGFAAEDTAVPIAFIRKYLMTDGTIVGHPYGRKNEIVRRLRDADNTVRLLRFKREGANDIALVNFCTHPDVIGGEYLSADWPGFVRRYVEQDLEGVSCLLLNGVQGDSNHFDYLTEPKKGHDHAGFMGRTIADTVLRIWDRTVPQASTEVKGGIETVFLPTRTDGMEDYEQCKQLLDDVNNKKPGVKPTGAQLGRAGRITRMRTSPMFMQVPVTVMMLGDVAFVGFGGEPFTHYATAVCEACPDKKIISACCCNGHEGYLPTAEEYEIPDSYEGNSSPFPSNLEEECVKAAVGLIERL
ncbi:MAG: hypothetical protein IJX80_01265 [Clostridia bacterium]|nr:hypothetical protein [Clostridia bacterium]